MKTRHHLLPSRFLACATALFLAAGMLPIAAAEVNISYEEPEKFSDMGGDQSYFFDERTFKQFKNTFSDKMKGVANKHLSSDATLSVTVRDVDLAGEVEPTRGSGATEIRVLRDVYPPRIKFKYEITGSEDRTLTEGVAQLSDRNYLWGVNVVRRDDPFYYEMQLIEEWGRKTLSQVGQSREGQNQNDQQSGR